MRNTRLVILVIVSFVATLSLVQGIVNFSKRSRARNPVVSADPVQPVTIPPSAIGTVTKGIRPARTRYPQWGRNPFTFVEEGSQDPAAGIFLSGIAWDGKRSQAVINERIVSAGDEIAGYTVVEVKPTHVILNDGSANFELRLSRKK